MKTYHIPQIGSTNSYLLQLLSSADGLLEDGQVIYTMRQKEGRGQVGNKWESEPDQNILFSQYIEAGRWLEVRDQFMLSVATSLAVRDALETVGVANATIKWPNDIYAGDKKICGILIENRIFSARNWQSVIGVGINVNQCVWTGDAPNPTSIKLETGLNQDPVYVLNLVLLRMKGLMNEIAQGRGDAVVNDYLSHLYRAPGTGFYPYVDVATGDTFMAETITIENNGYLHLRAEYEDTDRRYMFKEVKFVLPDGLTKE